MKADYCKQCRAPLRLIGGHYYCPRCKQLARPSSASRRPITWLSIIAASLGLWSVAGISYAKVFHGFPACEIAHPDNCTEFVSPSLAGCRDLLGTFLCHHNKACHSGDGGCACDGPGIAELEGLSVPNDCEDEGVLNGWYAYDRGTLVRYKNLKACRAVSHHCVGIGMPNFEQGFTLR